MARILGIIGGGQLGMMLTEAARGMPEISKVIVLDPGRNCPASQAGAEQITAGFGDEEAVRELAARSDIITYEIESGNSEVLKSVQKDAEINPSPETLKIIQDKLLQKSFLRENGIPVADFFPVSTATELGERAEAFGFPVLLKARRDAYDGRGNCRISDAGGIGPAFELFKDRPVFVEKFVDFKMEVSVMASRNTGGQIKTYPLVENIHEESILRMSIAPARIGGEVSVRAEKIAHDAMRVLKGAGVFGIEMFVTRNDDVLINEIAPRVHNSGHHTLQSSKTSQFEQHLRAILGMELGGTELLRAAVMCNILGPDGFTGRYLPVTCKEDGVSLKMYGKELSKPRRKLGHFNVIGGDSIGDLIKRAKNLRRSITVEPAG